MTENNTWFDLGLRAALGGRYATYGELVLALLLAHVTVTDSGALWRGWQAGMQVVALRERHA